MGQLLLHKTAFLPSYYLRWSSCCRWTFIQRFLLLTQWRAIGELRCPAYGKSRNKAEFCLIKPNKTLSKKRREKENKCWIVILSPVEFSSAKAEIYWQLAEARNTWLALKGKSKLVYKFTTKALARFSFSTWFFFTVCLEMLWSVQFLLLRNSTKQMLIRLACNLKCQVKQLSWRSWAPLGAWGFHVLTKRKKKTT